jgi:hypothetical protein
VRLTGGSGLRSLELGCAAGRATANHVSGDGGRLKAGLELTRGGFGAGRGVAPTDMQAKLCRPYGRLPLIGQVFAISTVSVDAKVFVEARGVQDFVRLEALLIRKDCNKAVPNALRGPRKHFVRCRQRGLPGKEKKRRFLLGDCGKAWGGDWGVHWGDVQLCADESVEVADCVDGCGFAVLNVDLEKLFRAEDDFYSVEAHRSRLARKRLDAQVTKELLDTVRGVVGSSILANAQRTQRS